MKRRIQIRPNFAPGFTMKLLASVMLALWLAQPLKAQTIEKLDLVLGPPIYNNNKGDGYYYEVRGNIYAKGTAFNCPSKEEASSGNRIGTYRIGVSFGGSSESIGNYFVRLSDNRILSWQGYVKFDPNEDGSEVSWPYEGIVLHSDKQILADFMPLSKTCFGGKLIIYFLN